MCTALVRPMAWTFWLLNEPPSTSSANSLLGTPELVCTPPWSLVTGPQT